MKSLTYKIFDYIEALDAFVINPEYKRIANELGLTEWSEVVWIGRFFTLDNDYGEHWFDNWELRDQKEDKAKELGISSDDLLIIDPFRFKNDKDPVGHTDDEIKGFWTDVLKSLELSLDTLGREAIRMNSKRNKEDGLIPDLPERLEKIKRNSAQQK
jgi:hypothetical protein